MTATDAIYRSTAAEVRKGTGHVSYYKAQEVLLLSAPSPSPIPHSCSWAERSQEFFHGPLHISV